MDFKDIQQKLEVAIATLRFNDPELVDFDELDLPERPISHRLGYYLQSLFSEYHVDCEYNKHFEGKKVEGIPDIVVHRRKTDERNLLALEIKARKAKSEITKARDRGEIIEDYRKLRLYTRPDGLGYRWGVFVLLFPGDQILEWFESGREVQKLTIQSD